MTPTDLQPVRLLRIPHPCKAMMAICSDLDETPDHRVYWETMRFLNTTQTTPMGSGVGLEVGNTIYFDMPPNQFAYWNTDAAGRHMVRALIHSGHIDCLHSFGDLATTRDHACRALDELAAHDCRLEVWIDHSVAPSNFGADIMQGSGDVPGATAYHADITSQYGVRYVWRGRVTSVIGQDVPPRLGGLFTARHPFASARTLAKEAIKGVLARHGNGKYSIHAENCALRTERLRDGRPVYEFFRCNPHWGGVSSCETARGIGQVLTENMLNRLIHRGGLCILYTHLGKIDDPHRPFDVSAMNGFRRLADAHHSGRILATTTRRLLRYVTVRDYLRYRLERLGETSVITLDSVDDPIAGSRTPSPDEVQGITFAIPRTRSVEVRIAGRQPVSCEAIHNGTLTRVTVPWRPLAFPE